MPRFLLPAGDWNSSPALTGDEARHVAQVLRMKPGDGLIVFDGAGRRASAEILDVSRDRVSLRIGEILPTHPARPLVTLAQAIPKGKNMDLIVQKSVELGVAAIQPLVTRNTVVQPGEGKAEKWRRTALEACKQCGQDTLPQIDEPAKFDDWLAQPHQGLLLMASLSEGARPLREILRVRGNTDQVVLMIGPEGDFSPAETSAALAAGFTPVSLGSIVLRVETATLYCLSALRYEFETNVFENVQS